MRYLPLTEAETRKILDLCKVSSFEELTPEIPADLRLKQDLDLAPALVECELIEHLATLGKRNAAASMTCHLGQGVYDHTWPTVIDQLCNRGEFLTAYTPYQPELSQGTLQTIFEFQSLTSDLLGTEIANASLYDGSTALVEAVLMAARLNGKKSGTVLVAEGAYKRCRKILESYLTPLNFKLEIWYANPKTFLCESSFQPVATDIVAVVAQSPNKWGLIENWSEARALADRLGTKAVGYVAHPLSLSLFAAPGHEGIDIVAGEGQALGLPMGFGGPHLGLFGCRRADVRQAPGRLVGATVDSHGKRAFCVTLATREQHIRREKATSNICSNQNLMALRSTMYMTIMGPSGMRHVAELSRAKASYAAQKFHAALALSAPEIQVLSGDAFNEICLLVPQKHALWIDDALTRAEAQGILAGVRVGVPGASGFAAGFSVAFTEKHTAAHIDRLVDILCPVKGTK